MKRKSLAMTTLPQTFLQVNNCVPALERNRNGKESRFREQNRVGNAVPSDRWFNCFYLFDLKSCSEKESLLVLVT